MRYEGVVSGMRRKKDVYTLAYEHKRDLEGEREKFKMEGEGEKKEGAHLLGCRSCCDLNP